MDSRSPLARARGLGAAHGGTHHWWMQRLTALALVPLSLWFAVALAALAAADHATATAWLQSPINAVLTLLLIGTLFYHMYLGLQVVVEDYVHGHGRKFVTLVAIRFATVTLAVTAAFAVIKVAVAG